MTRDVSKLQIDQVYYSPWCDEEGKVVDDGTVTRLSDSTYRITAADPCYRWFLIAGTDLDVEVTDISDETAGLAIQGQLSREVLEAATRQDWSDVKYFRGRRAEIGGVDVDVTRTGYTGDLGYELWIPADGALDVWDALFEVGVRFGIHPVGIPAMDVARVEAGLILIEADYTSARHAITPEQEYSPFELGLGRLVDFRKQADFIGGRAARRAVGRRPRAPARRARHRWVGIEAMFAKHGLAPRSRRWSTAPRYPSTRTAGRSAGATSYLGPHDQEDGGVRLGGQGAREARHRVSIDWTVEGERGKVGDRRAAALPGPAPQALLTAERHSSAAPRREPPSGTIVVPRVTSACRASRALRADPHRPRRRRRGPRIRGARRIPDQRRSSTGLLVLADRPVRRRRSPGDPRDAARPVPPAVPRAARGGAALVAAPSSPSRGRGIGG